MILNMIFIIFPPEFCLAIILFDFYFIQFLIQCLLCRTLQVLRLRGLIPRETKWDVVVDLFFYRDPEEAEKEEQAAKEVAVTKAVVEVS